MAAALLAPVLLAGCVSQSREQELGDLMAAEINAQLPLIADPLLNIYVNDLGRGIADVSGRPALDYRFYIIDSRTVNAFALPGGHIYITRGLINRTRTGPELAGVLAHEIGHVAARHGVQKLERHLRTGSLVALMYQFILGGEPDLLRSNSLRLAGTLWNASHSREDEEEADRLAVDYLLDSRIDPEGIVTLLETLLEEEVADSGVVAAWFSTHPMTASRIRIAEREIDDEMTDDHPPPDRELSSYPAFMRRISALPPPPDAEPDS
jgi:predicted Zn-dependent protease